MQATYEEFYHSYKRLTTLGYLLLLQYVPTLQSNSHLWSLVTALVITSLLILATHAFVLETNILTTMEMIS